ncbi:UBA-like domain-containing protein 1 isoform X1 [Lagenorhynchus albirostris]|uniref:UBA-like domain-containing protein 1 isoform X1 n=1 Tax=Lagenorhynchus albirostris TaxID=27610 RepID=UPI0028E95E3E|nr:UBA-like domain-containing protein 1 isoform X1 [Lagenorhynchus albirostris]
MPSPCSPVSRPPRASTAEAAAARWPPRPRRPRRTSHSPPPAASRHPAGRLRPRPQGGHSTTSRSSRPCGLRHPLPRCQTGRPWSPNRPPQNPEPTLPWRPRDKGGPSPLPEARTPWGGGEDVSAGPLHPLSAPPFPRALGGRDRTLVPVRRLPACVPSSAGLRHPAFMDLVQSRLGAGGQNLREQAAFPRGLTCPTPPQGAAELPGAGGPRSPPSGMQSLLRMCACRCVCVFICMSLFEKQPSLWGSWTLHVRVSPLSPCPPSLSPGPCPSPLPPGQSALLFPAEKRIVGNSRTLPTHPPAPACWGCLHASPEPGGTPSPVPFPLLTKEKKEFQTTTRLCGLASYPKLCCQLALCGGGGSQRSPEQGPTPQSRLAPHRSCLLLSFQPQHALKSSCPPQAFPMKLVPALCSQNPCLHLLTLPPVRLDRSRPPGLTAAFRSARVSQRTFLPGLGPQ